jgi:hypothetical protein
MALSFVCGNTIVIVLDEENIERVQQNDPFDLDMRKMGTVTLPIPFRISIAYARKDELPTLTKFMEAKDIEGLMEYLSRGFKVTASDHDRGYELYHTISRG